MTSPAVSVIIPAYNEAECIGPVLDALEAEYEVIVVDDASHDSSVEVAREQGARVIEHEQNRGYIRSLKDGFAAAHGEILVTMDADGEHNPADVSRLVEPIRAGEQT